jgi:hypothetical protein
MTLNHCNRCLLLCKNLVLIIMFFFFDLLLIFQFDKIKKNISILKVSECIVFHYLRKKSFTKIKLMKEKYDIYVSKLQ